MLKKKRGYRQPGFQYNYGPRPTDPELFNKNQLIRSFAWFLFTEFNMFVVCSNANPLHYYALQVPPKADKWR